jgi:anti-anti-sigma factor
MNGSRLDSTVQFFSGVRVVSGIRELVRGREQEILEALEPLVHTRSVRLDLSSIERIDAAGMAALVSLYCAACQAGHEFAVVNPPRRVAGILAMVGLDRILVQRDSGERLRPGPRMGMMAA